MEHYKKLLGEKVYLSPVSEGDAVKFAPWMNDMEVTDFTRATEKVYTLADEKEWVANVGKGEDIVFSIVRVDNDETIGNISFMEIKRTHRIATLGIMIGDSENRSKGYGREAIELILDYGFNYLNFNNIGLTVLSCNERATKCYTNAGFKEYGRRRESVFVNGKYYDIVHMDILAREFTKCAIKNKNVGK